MRMPQRGLWTRVMLPLLFLLGGAVAPGALAQVADDRADESAREAVVRYVDALLATVAEARPLYESDRPAYLQAVGAALEDFVDFREAARGVMARYSTGPRGATPAQLDRFARVFKDSLIDFYGSALASYGGGGYQIVENPGDRQEDDAATVRMEVLGEDGQRFELLYAMYRNPQGQWKLRNLNVEGVDLRRQYHSRFDDLMAQHDYDIDAVIDNWPAAQAAQTEESF